MQNEKKCFFKNQMKNNFYKLQKIEMKDVKKGIKGRSTCP